MEKFGVSIDDLESDALAYHLMHTRNINGEFPAGYLPPDKYVVQTYVRLPTRKDPGLTVAMADGQTTVNRKRLGH